MGYVHDTSCAVRFPPEMMQASAGTWTNAAASNIWYTRRTAAASTAVLKIPLSTIVQNSSAGKGSLLKSVDIWYELSTAAASGITPVIQKQSLPADAAAYGAPSALAFSYDSGHDSAAKRLALQKHRMTLTLTTPVYLADGDDVYVELTVDCSSAGTAVFDYHGCRANISMRL